MSLVEARQLSYCYPGCSAPVIDQLDLTVETGEFVVLKGASGRGKTTVLNLIGGLVKPSGGQLRVSGLDLLAANDQQLAEMRSLHLGFVFQAFHLDEELSVLDNVLLPLYFSRQKLASGLERGLALLERVGLKSYIKRPITSLSGGQRQRVAIARALITSPQLLLADEPLGHLDALAASSVFELLAGLRTEHQLALVLTTHDSRIMQRADRLVDLDQLSQAVTSARKNSDEHQ